jgi:hypothetical protein
MPGRYVAGGSLPLSPTLPYAYLLARGYQFTAVRMDRDTAVMHMHEAGAATLSATAALKRAASALSPSSSSSPPPQSPSLSSSSRPVAATPSKDLPLRKPSTRSSTRVRGGDSDSDNESGGAGACSGGGGGADGLTGALSTHRLVHLELGI